VTAGTSADAIASAGVADEVRRYERRQSAKTTVRRIGVFVVFLILLALLYTGYKAFGEALDDAQTTWPVVGSFLPRSDDLTMPPIPDIVAEIGEPLNRTDDKPLGAFVWEAALFTAREAALGFFFGLMFGIGIAVVLVRSRWLERGVSPYIAMSQTIPLVAIAPIVIIWGRTSLDWLPFEWQDWMSVAIIAGYLTFFPVAVNGIRGLHSAQPEAFELMRSYAVKPRQELIRLRLPASMPYLFSAFKLAATLAVVGAIVGEISAGVPGGLGRLILDFAGRYTTGPERLYVSVGGAALLGILAFGLVVLTQRFVRSARVREGEPL
jgi:NitT/TauT family transport system permease protein